MAWLAPAMALAAALYASVGHGGASAYIALMALAGAAPEVIRPSALLLNVLVAGVAAFQFARARQFDARLFLIVASAGVPAAFVSAKIDLPRQLFEPLLAVALLAAAARYLAWPRLDAERPWRSPPLVLAVLAGGGLGALAGLTGIGGGVYLSPLLIFCGWAKPKQAAGVAAAFIVVNSLAGLASRPDLIANVPELFPLMALGVLAGAVAGASLSLSTFTQSQMLRALGIVLGLAATALLL